MRYTGHAIHAVPISGTEKKHVTLQLLWYEYRQGNPNGYQYSYFCELYQRWRKGLDISLRQEHLAGEKAFIDYAGQTVPVIDPDTGNVDFEAQIFIAALVHNAHKINLKGESMRKIRSSLTKPTKSGR